MEHVPSSIATWLYSTTHNVPCQIIEEQTLWGQSTCRIWLPSKETVVRVPRSTLQPLPAELNPTTEAQRILYVASAAKVANVLQGSHTSADEQVLLAPMESNVIPLPHQLQALARAISGDRIRYLLADEVGLGKTIEAGLIMRELKLRGLVRRILVVAPKGLATQWVSEMQTHFNEHFQLVLGEDIGTLQKMARTTQATESDDASRPNPWRHIDQVIVSLDSVKPMDKRRGWSAERIAAYNRSRFEDLVTAGWDLVVVDEAHRLGGSTDQVARFRLGQGLAESTPYFLLLSATPHQGKTDAFHRLMSLLDERTFPDIDAVTRERVAPFVIRTEKRKAIDAQGAPLFRPRRTQLTPIAWAARHQAQELLYEAVTDYVRDGYNQALQEKKRHIGFLMILMQRLVVSSTRAIRTTLERRLTALNADHQETLEQLTVQTDESVTATMDFARMGERGAEEDASDAEHLYDLDGQELLETLTHPLVQSQLAALQNERLHVETLLEAALKCEQAGPDAKAEALLDWIYQLQADENEPDLKVLIFTEFVPTQAMLKEFLEARGISVATLNGTMSMEERKLAQDAFRNQSRVLVSTDAGGEGLNLQFCHVIINYDIPWNPMRLEQRIGRVDRIGQPKVVRAINFVFEESVEFRVREVLEQKLAVIFEEFGIDKTGDVLDSAHAGELFEDLFTSALLAPDMVEESVEKTVYQLRDEIHAVRESAAVYSVSAEPDQESAERYRTHPLPHWIERMTVSYIRSCNGSAAQSLLGWALQWPNEADQSHVVFTAKEAERLPDATLLNLEDRRVRGLALSPPQLVAGQPIPIASLDGVPATVSGLWGLYEIRLQSSHHQQSDLLRIPLVRHTYLSVFVSDEGKHYLPTARHIWDSLQSVDPIVNGTLESGLAAAVHDQLQTAVEETGQSAFAGLEATHLAAITAEEARGIIAFSARRKAIERIGLLEVRQYRLARCDAEEFEWRAELATAREFIPEMRPLLIVRIVPRGSDG